MFLVGDAAAMPFPDDSFQAVVTSPPYWKARDYGLGTDQLGFEDRVADYITNLVTILRETRRVLRPDGTLWVVIGDSYNTRAKIRTSAHNPGLGHDDSSVGESATESWAERSRKGMVKHSSRTGSNLKDKDLVLVPERFAIAMVDDGWFLRSEIIWYKPYGKPERVHDRPSITHEKIFMFTKNPVYKFYKTDESKRSVWQMKPGTGVHGVSGPAVFPAELVRRCLQASTDVGDHVLDPFAGSGVTLHTASFLGRVPTGVDRSAEWWSADRLTGTRRPSVRRGEHYDLFGEPRPSGDLYIL